MNERRDEVKQGGRCVVCGASPVSPLGLCESDEVDWLRSYENARAEQATSTAAERCAFDDFVRRRLAERQNGES